MTTVISTRDHANVRAHGDNVTGNGEKKSGEATLVIVVCLTILAILATTTCCAVYFCIRKYFCRRNAKTMGINYDSGETANYANKGSLNMSLTPKTIPTVQNAVDSSLSPPSGQSIQYKSPNSKASGKSLKSSPTSQSSSPSIKETSRISLSPTAHVSNISGSNRARKSPSRGSPTGNKEVKLPNRVVSMIDRPFITADMIKQQRGDPKREVLLFKAHSFAE